MGTPAGSKRIAALPGRITPPAVAPWKNMAGTARKMDNPIQMSDNPLQQQVEARTQQLLATARQHFQQDPGQVVIRFDLTGKAAGMAMFPSRGTPVIRYNALLLTENRDDFLRRTVPHEVAHVVARRLFGRKIRPHGAEWRQVMQLFGAEASRCHNYDVTRSARRTLKRYAYRCDCRTHQLSSIRHNRVKRGQTYHCLACKQPLVALEKTDSSDR